MYTVLSPETSRLTEIIEAYNERTRVLKGFDKEFEYCMTEYGVGDTPFIAAWEGLILHVRAQDVSKHIERAIKGTLNLKKAGDGESGDALSTNGEKIEIKAPSCFLEATKWHIKSIRPFHDLSHYLFHLYDGYRRTCNWIYVPATHLYDLCNQYGYFKASTQGTKATNKDNPNVQRQFMIYPHNGLETKEGRFWNDLQQYSTDVETLYYKFNDAKAPMGPKHPDY